MAGHSAHGGSLHGHRSRRRLLSSSRGKAILATILLCAGVLLSGPHSGMTLLLARKPAGSSAKPGQHAAQRLQGGRRGFQKTTPDEPKAGGQAQQTLAGQTGLGGSASGSSVPARSVDEVPSKESLGGATEGSSSSSPGGEAASGVSTNGVSAASSTDLPEQILEAASDGSSDGTLASNEEFLLEGAQVPFDAKEDDSKEQDAEQMAANIWDEEASSSAGEASEMSEEMRRQEPHPGEYAGQADPGDPTAHAHESDENGSGSQAEAQNLESQQSQVWAREGEDGQRHRLSAGHVAGGQQVGLDSGEAAARELARRFSEAARGSGRDAEDAGRGSRGGRAEAGAGELLARFDRMWDKANPRDRNVFSDAAPEKNKSAAAERVAQMRTPFIEDWRSKHPWPPISPLQQSMVQRNQAPVRNAHIPLPPDGPAIVIVMYVFKRANYLRTTLQGLAQVAGIQNALLVISHDGVFPEVEALVQSIAFCQVKQLHAPWSPHNFFNTFPGVSPSDCKPTKGSVFWPQCDGTPDNYMHHRDPRVVSLKHHFWWLLNTVWDGLEETKGYAGHILILEEDHYPMPNALLQTQALISMKQGPLSQHCVAVNLADEHDHLIKTQSYLFEPGNRGLIFNRTIWEALHYQFEEFCGFDDYNWDYALLVYLIRKWPVRMSLRWGRDSVVHIGTCGLHVGKNVTQEACTPKTPPILPVDLQVAPIFDSPVFQDAPKPRAQAWGGWGDERDRELCRYFSTMYRISR